MKQLTHIWEATGRQSHRTTGHKYSTHNKQVRVWLIHLLTDLLDKREHNQRSNCVTDEGGNHQDQSSKDNENTVKAHAFNTACNGLGDSVQQSRGIDRLAQRKTAGCQDDNGPEKVVEIFFGENTCAEEEHKRNDGYDAHITKDVFKLMTDTPENDSDNGNDADEPLDASELVLQRSDGNDGGVLSRLEGYKE